MKPAAVVRLIVASVLLGTPSVLVAEHDAEHIGTWSSCVPSSLTACASVTLSKDLFGGHPNSFVAILDSPGAFPVGSGEFRVTAWGFYLPRPSTLTFELIRAEDAWGGPPPGWGPGFVFATSTSVWDQALGGPGFGGDGFWGFWEGGPLPDDLRFAWRATTLDGGRTFDCIQAAPDTTDCVSVAPEPATWALMLTGLAGLGMLHRIRRKRSVAGTRG
jgi:hypothetical protein